MQYVSTRGEAPTLGFIDVTLAGLARDGGLYVPQSWPRLSPDTIASFAGKPYAEVAVEVIRPFTGDQISVHDLSRIAREAYGTFRHPAVAPLSQIDANTFLLELFHGPTLAFKDLAMQFLARLMDHALEQRGERVTIAVATSGDTGGAAVEAFRGRNRIDLVVLFPEGRVSDVQRRMMTTADDANIHAVAVQGNFDDCQALVKGMFNHHAFADRVRLAGVNSINWARIVAQAVYYFTAAVALGAPHRKVGFTVPTGNFGDIFAGHVARSMGLPIDRLVIATNVNDILVRTLTTGAYEPREVVATSSPSMDIQVSSNFERLLFEAYRRDAAAIRAPDERLCAIEALRDRGRSARRHPRRLCRRPRRRGRGRRHHAHGVARDRPFRRSAHRRRHRGRGEGAARSGTADGRAVHRTCGKIPGRGGGRLRRTSALAGLAVRPERAARARHRAAARPERDRNICSCGLAGRA